MSRFVSVTNNIRGLTITLVRHVSDVAEAFDVIVHKGIIGETYNIGTNLERSVLQVANDICVHFNRDPLKSIEYVSDRLFNDRRYVVFPRASWWLDP